MPSTNEFAAFYRINPATAAKGINILVDDGMLEKRRGIGMFVVAGARDRLIQLRRKEFAEQYVEPLLAEARRLGIDADELVDLIRQAPDREEIQQHSTTQKGGGVMTAAVVVDHLSRRYRGVTALDDVSVAFAEGHHHRSAGPQRGRQVHPDADHHRAGVRHPPARSACTARTRWRTTTYCARMSFVKESQIYPDIKVKRR